METTIMGLVRSSDLVFNLVGSCSSEAVSNSRDNRGIYGDYIGQIIGFYGPNTTTIVVFGP